jgi:hypothetical protein
MCWSRASYCPRRRARVTLAKSASWLRGASIGSSGLDRMDSMVSATRYASIPRNASTKRTGNVNIRKSTFMATLQQNLLLTFQVSLALHVCGSIHIRLMERLLRVNAAATRLDRLHAETTTGSGLAAANSRKESTKVRIFKGKCLRLTYTR